MSAGIESKPASNGSNAVFSTGRLSTIFLATVIGIAVIGYFVGLADGVPQPDGMQASALESIEHSASDVASTTLMLHGQPMPAVTYAEVPTTAMGPTATWKTSLSQLPQPQYDLFAEIVLSAEDKQRSGMIRASRRAFNGAPPVIPHTVEGTTDSACYACHSAGMKIGALRAGVMSHAYLANCTQCHAPPPPVVLEDYATPVSSEFQGLPAPLAGQRAFSGAPPTMPHSQFMRENCAACHGGPNGWAGMESTHPWRTNCTQCHAPSAALDQAVLATADAMLPPIVVRDGNGN